MHGRMRGVLVALTLVTVLVSTSGCTGAVQLALATLDRPQPAPEEPPFPGVDRAVLPSLGRVEPPEVERINARQGEPTDVFGRRMVAQGYAEAVYFAAATTFSAKAMVPETQELDSFTGYRDRMTQHLWRDVYDGTVDCFEGDTEACDVLYARQFFWTGHEDEDLQKSGPLVINHRIRKPSLWVDRTFDEPRLAVRFEQQADVRVRQDGEDLLLPFTKDQSYALVPAPEGSPHAWKVDGLGATWSLGDLEPDTGTY